MRCFALYFSYFKRKNNGKFHAIKYTNTSCPYQLNNQFIKYYNSTIGKIYNNNINLLYKS